MKTLKSYKSTIPSDMNAICCTVNQIVDFLQHNAGVLDECCLFEVKVILNELIINAVKHGNKCNVNKHVNITAGIKHAKYFYMIVEDQGEGYDYKGLIENESIMDLIYNPCALKETGRGILIVKNLSDRLRFNSKGNKVMVIKKIGKA